MSAADVLTALALALSFLLWMGVSLWLVSRVALWTDRKAVEWVERRASRPSPKSKESGPA